MYVLSCSSVSSMRGSRGGLGRGRGVINSNLLISRSKFTEKRPRIPPPSTGKHNYPLDPLPGKIFWIHACALVTCR